MKCHRCPNEAGHYWSCPECRAAKAVYQSARRADYRKANLCLVCGNPSVQGRRHCSKHLEYYRKRLQSHSRQS